VLENLCENAIKYGAAGRPVAVGLKQCEDRVTIAVHNEGMPIPAADQAKLFQAFKRIEGEERAQGGKTGWGLGLTLVKGIAEAHGGTVTVQSEPGTGTVFSVILPRDSRGAANP
jgi:signal transduction histidine kinase